jgi:hypothetical protein
MIRVLNNFLNSFEAFFWRSLIAIFFLIIIPFVAILFVFGFLNLKVEKQENNE